MADFSDVERFAHRLNRASVTEELEEEWRDEWAPRLAAEMENQAPRLTGHLAGSIRASAEGVEVGADYAFYVARGTSRMAPQPFDLLSIETVRPRAAKGAGRLAIDRLTR
jgi:hypothetical protein